MSVPVHVVLSYLNGKRQLSVNGEPMKHVRSVSVTLDANDIPHVNVLFTPVSFTVEVDEADLVADSPIVETFPTK